MVALAIGTALALVALGYVLHPLFADPPGAASTPAPAAPRKPAEAARAIEALRDVEFDRATGILADDDYDALKRTYLAAAVRAMRAAEHGVEHPAAPDEAMEALIERYRGRVVACPACGERPERAAVFCSSCGRPLPEDETRSTDA